MRRVELNVDHKGVMNFYFESGTRSQEAGGRGAFKRLIKQYSLGPLSDVMLFSRTPLPLRITLRRSAALTELFRFPLE